MDFLEGFKTLDFLEGFKIEPKDLSVIKRTADFTCPPSTPATTKVSAEGRTNYATLSPNAAAGYGMTGLMAMQTWQTACYGQVLPGYIFLFPGIYNDTPPPYQGTVNLNCAAHPPINSSGGALHAQMCTILGRPTTDFIGFSCTFPFNGAGNMGYNSWTCNPYWFNGTNQIPANCNGTNWQSIVYNALLTWLPHQ